MTLDLEESATANKRKLGSQSSSPLVSSKSQKLSSSPSSTSAPTSSTSAVSEKFSPGLFESKDAVKDSIAASGPYKHAVISNFVNDELLRTVKKEILENLHFTKKETDIYKVYQTGDLRNLSGLDKSELDKLGGLFQLREALYSLEFRQYLSYVTGSGALSGTKQDLSINVYHKGCQLLTHDDVIGSRRISYILYLPDPDEKWDYPRWGGALRLYPTVKPNVPAKDWCLEIPPAWNQLAFFTVQPGQSFHDVEEVFVDKPRVSISGWFHIPQKGEDGYIEGEQEATEAKSSLQQLESNEIQEFDFPKKKYELIGQTEAIKATVKSAQDKLHLVQEATTSPQTDDDDDTPLSSADFSYLVKYMNPTLLKTPSIKMLSQYFCAESALEIRDFLNADYSQVLKKVIDKIDLNENDDTPKKSADVDALPFWKLAGPPHKARYMYMDGLKSYEAESATEKFKVDFSKLSLDQEEGTNNIKSTDADKKLAEVATMLSSPQFRVWLQLVSSLTPLAQSIVTRRFRPGLDYTLATTNTGLSTAAGGKEEEGEDQEDNENESLVLEGTLCLTPTLGWAEGELGGYELSMMGEDETDPSNKDLDPAVYRGSSTAGYSNSSTGERKDQTEDDDAVLLTCQAEWNVLSLMVRDAGILKFVKYVSGNAPGSRWDIAAEWPVENNDIDDEDEEDDD